MGKRKRGKQRDRSHIAAEHDHDLKPELSPRTACLSAPKDPGPTQLPEKGQVSNHHASPSPTSSKKRRREENKVDASASGDTSNERGETRDNSATIPLALPSGPTFPFPTDPDDHCESPPQAYTDIAPLLHCSMMCSLRDTTKQKKNDTLYDPYYCNGAVVEHLNSLGFANVYNRKEDCYKVWATPGRYPSFSVLVTNPPYSSDHIEKLLNHVTSPKFGDRPWFLLLPNWVVKKDYYQQATQRIQPFYIVPRKRYVYVPPRDFRVAKPSDVHKKSSPFVSMWYIWGGTMERNEELIQRHYQELKVRQGGRKEVLCDLARSKSALRDLRRKQR